jgi:hypothetical protein
MQQYENVTMGKSENATDGMLIYDIFYVSYFRFVVSKIRKSENTKRQQSQTLSSHRVFAFSHFEAKKRKYDMA